MTPLDFAAVAEAYQAFWHDHGIIDFGATDDPRARELERRMVLSRYLMQVNCSGEGQKSGVAVGAAQHLGAQIADMKGLRLMGLMTMAKHGVDEGEARRTFARCREIFEEMQKAGIAGDDLRHLSMGMSDDLEAGVLEGATVLRVGSALFGKREENPEL